MKTENLLNFSYRDGDISCHVRATKYVGAAGTKFIVSWHNTMTDVELTVEPQPNELFALDRARRLRDSMRMDICIDLSD